MAIRSQTSDMIARYPRICISNSRSRAPSRDVWPGAHSELYMQHKSYTPLCSPGQKMYTQHSPLGNKT